MYQHSDPPQASRYCSWVGQAIWGKARDIFVTLSRQKLKVFEAGTHVINPFHRWERGKMTCSGMHLKKDSPGWTLTQSAAGSCLGCAHLSNHCLSTGPEVALEWLTQTFRVRLHVQLAG